MITSRHNAKIVLVRSLLGRPRERRAEAAFVVEGVRLVEEALDAGWGFRFALHVPRLTGRGRDLLRRLAAAGVDLEPVSAPLMDSISETESPQGVLAVLAMQTLPLPAKLDFALIPDAIRDPGNLGTLLRTAAAAGVQAVFLPPETADAFAPKVVRAGMGAHFRLPLHALGWDELRTQLKGMKVYLAETSGPTSCWQADFRLPLALIVGGEAEGASPSARRLATDQVFIPMPGGSESLNAAVAGAVLMFEVLRQRRGS